MAFKMRELSVHSYSVNGMTIWGYKAGAETLADVMMPGYFDKAAEMLANGDFIMISALDWGRVVIVRLAQGDALVTVAALI